VAAVLQRLEHLLPEMDTAVVERDRDAHDYDTRVRSAAARATTLSTV
jgi:hypothetical protein